MLLKNLRNCVAVFHMLAAALICALAPVSATAQEHDARQQGQMTVATREAPPFAMKDEDGAWHGIAIDLWQTIAAERGYRYHFVESDLPGMIDGLVDGRYDASVGALTITSGREAEVDFTHPFYATGFGIAVNKSSSGWYSLVRNFFTLDFLKAILALSAVLLFVGFLFWLAERKRNPEEFAEGAAGIGSGFWFSAVTMTTVGYGDKAPRTAAGKAIALVWMFAAIIIISTFTGMIASSLTAGRLAGAISGPDDLPGVTVGSIRGSATDEWLSDEGIGFSSYPDVETGLAALRDGKIDAFVYDEPLLRYLVRASFNDRLRLLPGTFGRQDYGIALPQGSPLREAVDISLLHHIESSAWRDEIKETLGKRN
ncbi:ABC transporter substrate-binding protein [Croceicoccus estronivorus]|uniref:transporter substrate-binding domain-containing protein n=1 Tax=Croceicoccus estronivorus TaxID=1172626 RepID=UPI000829BF09|nr:transporter substrate-binding domain-containing protein [Croceicoccus estronivorus]OCC22441.1 ABC transporter substrate-binding protein [Croceicoccus estronivorus]